MLGTRPGCTLGLANHRRTRIRLCRGRTFTSWCWLRWREGFTRGCALRNRLHHPLRL